MTRGKVLALAMVLAAAAALVAGCMPSTEMQGVRIPNTRPDTRITGEPPSIIEAGFVVQFYWTGADPDGRVVGYQWKMSENGTDGISVRDTLTFDPATGDTLNPWLFTTSTDSIFIVSADIPEYPNDPPNGQRSFETHTLWIRAIDEVGAVDPTPAFMSFTSLTLLPTIIVDTPVSFFGQSSALRAPSSITFGWTGDDPDWEAGTPTAVRYLFKEAFVPGVGYIATRADYITYQEELVSFDDSVWSDWVPYAEEEIERRVTFPEQPARDDEGELIRYLFAIQARDTAGAVSIGRTYGTNVMNAFVSSTITPELQIFEPFLGLVNTSGTEGSRSYDIASSQPLNFSWIATAEPYAGEIVSYRYGWDVTDVTDPDDPGWAISPGLTPQHTSSPTNVFDSGIHTLTIVAIDNSSQVTRFQIVLNVVPVPDPGNQRPILVVDDANDRDSERWPGAPPDNNIKYDHDFYRDQFWTDGPQSVVGALSGGVENFVPSEDINDSEDRILDYRRSVQYRVLLWMSKFTSASSNSIASQFRPTFENNQILDKFIWLAPYQEQVGNLLFVSERGMNQFVAQRNYMLPFVFDTTEETLSVNDVTYIVGWPERELPNGNTLRLGPDRYPYRVIGVSWVDQMTPRQYNIYGRALLGDNDRRRSCCSLKALVLDPDFRDFYQPSQSAIPDTIWTEPTIDWRDSDPLGDPPGPNTSYLQESYSFGLDEFYDQNIASRPTSLNLQMCDDGGVSAPCIIPMFRALSRYDWFRLKFREADPDTLWPFGNPPAYGNAELDAICGELGLDLALGRETARTNDVMVGFVSIKTRQNKPSRKGDVIWGFDPYRFDVTQMTRTVRWVLGEHFGLVLRP